MTILQKVRNHFINAFRELFLYHHSSLEFRAKLFAAIIAANPSAGECEYAVVAKAGLQIYDDPDRSNSLLLTVHEYVDKVTKNNGLDLDTLLADIVRDLRDLPRYSQKINVLQLRPLLDCHHDEENRIYQERMLELFTNLREEYMNGAQSFEGR